MENDFEYDLAVAAIAKDEAPYIKEWVDYHLTIGVEYFYIYDNDSIDNLREALQPYIAAGKVEYIYYPGKYRQMEAYNDVIRRHKFDARYMAFIDIDEFILPLQKERIMDILEDIFKSDSHIAGLAMNCKSFGSSGHKKKPQTGGVLENYLHRAPDGYEWSKFPWKWDAHVKTIVDPRKVLDYVSPHFPKYFRGFYSVDEYGEHRVDGMDNFTDKVSRIRINHYFTKSKEEWIKKRNKGLATNSGYRPLEEFEWRDRNEVFDDSILKYRVFCQKHPCNNRDEKKHVPLGNRFAELYDHMVMHPSPDYWKNGLGKLMQCWGIYRRELRKKKEPDWQILLWKNLVFAAMIKSLRSKVVDTYSLELVASIWKELGSEADSISKDFQKLYIDTLQSVILFYRSKNDIDAERYFSDKIQEIFKQSQ